MEERVNKKSYWNAVVCLRIINTFLGNRDLNGRLEDIEEELPKVRMGWPGLWQIFMRLMAESSGKERYR